ncbi:hypothetical protein [Streptomyces sp. NPDC002537]
MLADRLRKSFQRTTNYAGASRIIRFQLSGARPLHLIKQRLWNGRISKARRSDLVVPLPFGYLRQPTAKVVPDPDEQLQAVVERYRECSIQMREKAMPTNRFDISKPIPQRQTNGSGDNVFKILLPRILMHNGQLATQYERFTVYRVRPGILVCPGHGMYMNLRDQRIISPNAQTDPQSPEAQAYLDDVCDMLDQLERTAPGELLLEHVRNAQPISPPEDYVQAERDRCRDAGRAYWARYVRYDPGQAQPEFLDDGVLITPPALGNSDLLRDKPDENWKALDAQAEANSTIASKPAPDWFTDEIKKAQAEVQNGESSQQIRQRIEHITGIWNSGSSGSQKMDGPWQGCGSTARIYYDPRSTIIVNDPLAEIPGATSGPAPSGGWKKLAMPPEVGLGHELIHALHMLLGRRFDGKVKCHQPQPNKNSTISSIGKFLGIGAASTYTSVTIKGEELDTGPSRQAISTILEETKRAVEVPGLIDKIPDSAARAYNLRQALLGFMKRLRDTNLTGSIQAVRSTPDGVTVQHSLEQQSINLDVTALFCEGELATASPVGRPLRFAYNPATVERVKVNAGVPLKIDDQAQHNRCWESACTERDPLSYNADWGNIVSNGTTQTVTGSVFATHQLSSYPSFDKNLEPTRTLLTGIVGTQAQGTSPRCEAREELDLSNVSSSSTEAANWRAIWNKETGNVRLVSVMGDLSNDLRLPSGMQVWESAGWKKPNPGMNSVEGSSLYTATKSMYAKLLHTDSGVAKLEFESKEIEKSKATGGEWAQVGGLLLTYPNALASAFRDGSSKLEKAAALLSFEPRVSAFLYALDDISHGDYVGAVEVGAWLGAWTLADLILGSEVTFGAMVAFAVYDVIKQELAEADALKKEDEAAKAYVETFQQKWSTSIWPSQLNAITTSVSRTLAAEAVRIQAAAVHDAELASSAIENAVMLAFSSLSGGTRLGDAREKTQAKAGLWEPNFDPKSLYQKYLHSGDFTSYNALDQESRRKAYCRLSESIYRQLQLVVGEKFHDMIVKLKQHKGDVHGTPNTDEGKTAKGLALSYEAMMQVSRSLAGTLVAIPDNAFMRAQTSIDKLFKEDLIPSLGDNIVFGRAINDQVMRNIKSTYGEVWAYYIYRPLNPEGKLLPMDSNPLDDSLIINAQKTVKSSLSARDSDARIHRNTKDGRQSSVMADVLGLACWAAQERLIHAVWKVLEDSVTWSSSPTPIIIKNKKNSNSRVVRALNSSLPRIWEGGGSPYLNSSFGTPDGQDIDNAKLSSVIKPDFGRFVFDGLFGGYSTYSALSDKVLHDVSELIAKENATFDANEAKTPAEQQVLVDSAAAAHIQDIGKVRYGEMVDALEGVYNAISPALSRGAAAAAASERDKPSAWQEFNQALALSSIPSSFATVLSIYEALDNLTDCPVAWSYAKHLKGDLWEIGRDLRMFTHAINYPG